jgi:membrane associated rhomboid family serine protease
VDTEPGWVEVFASPARRACDERALVLMALDIPAVMLAVHGRFALLVSGADAPRAGLELERYALENRPRPTPVRPRLHSGALPAAAGYALALFLIAIASSRSLGHKDWYGSGVLDGARLRGGEWWRAITALTLHADLAHLAANVGFGALFGTLAARVYGAGAGWLLILVASILADAVDGLAMPAGQVSLGASTAVFAALGALAVHRWPASTRLARAGLRGGSVVAACVLLAFLGTGDQHTDVAAHALGFLAGSLLALPLRRWPPAAGPLQRLCAGLAVALLALGWAAALASGSARG